MSNDIFFTADTHFSHRMMAEKFRNLGTIEAMDELLIENWNKRVKKGDRVYHLGDFSLAKDMTEARKLADRLNGQIFLVKGNHEKVAEHTLVAPRFVWIKDYFYLKVGEQSIALSHYAHRVWNKSHHGAWHLYGHSHGSLTDDLSSKSFDVGVDCHNLAPVNFEEVSQLMSLRSWIPLDHHKGMHVD